MNLDLTNKTALVCGGSEGLGLATAKELAMLGATVIIVSRTESKLVAALARLERNAGQQHHYIVADLSMPEQTCASVQSWMQQHGDIQILINNAGGPPSGPMIETGANDLETGFRTHVISSHSLTQLLVPGMQRAGYGRIINVLSVAVKQPINGLGISNAVRAAVANWAKTLANEIADAGITVNNVLPGFTKTDRLQYLFSKQATEQGKEPAEIEKNIVSTIPAKRLGRPEEFGAVVAFLCTPAAAYINGTNISVDGGRTGCL